MVLNSTMFKADKIFEKVKHHLPVRGRTRAKVTFRRLIRKYVSYKIGGAINPVTGRISKKIIIGQRWVHTGGRWRRKSTVLGSKSKGRPDGLSTELLVSSLAVQWAVSRLRAELARVKMERDILGKATAYFAKAAK